MHIFRLRDICDDISKQTQPRKRSNSLPIPKIEVSVYQSPDVKDQDSLKNFIEVPEVKDLPVTEVAFPTPKLEEEPVMMRRSSEKIKRKMKMADLKAFVETKLLSKSEKALEKIGNDDHKFSFHTAVRMLSVDIVFLFDVFIQTLFRPYIDIRLGRNLLFCGLHKILRGRKIRPTKVSSC